MYKSKGYKNIMSAISIIESSFLEYKIENQDWDFMYYIDEVLEYCEEIYMALPKLLDIKDIEKFSKNVKAINKRFYFSYADKVASFSFMTLLLEESMEKIKDEKISVLLNQLGYLIGIVQSHSEKNRTSSYKSIDYAKKAFEFWKSLDW